MHGEEDGCREDINDLIMLFKITLRNQYKALGFTLFLFIATIILVVFFTITDPFFYVEIFIWLFLIQLIPVMGLHIEYLLLNAKHSLKIDYSLLIFHSTIGSKNNTFSFTQVSKIVLYLPPSAYRNRIERQIQFLPTEPYGYAKICLKEGDDLIITSLLIPDLIQEFSKTQGIILEKKKRIIASPFIEQIFTWIGKDGI